MNTKSNSLLQQSIQVWFLIATIGTWIFAFYVSVYYGSSAIMGNWAKWNETMPHGHEPGDGMNNVAMIAHIILAVIVLVCGPIQFMDYIRKKWRDFHRWNGRVYVFSGLLISINGLFIVFYKGTVSGFIGDLSMSLNAILIMVCAIFTWYYAVNKNFEAHSKWAIRLFLMMSGVWFFRIGLMFWLLVNDGKAIWFDMVAFQGPFLTILGFGQYIVPLIVAELYFFISKSRSPSLQLSFAIFMVLLIVWTTVGIFAATINLWLPRL